MSRDLFISDDSDQELMVPLAERLAAKGVKGLPNGLNTKRPTSPQTDMVTIKKLSPKKDLSVEDNLPKRSLNCIKKNMFEEGTPVIKAKHKREGMTPVQPLKPDPFSPCKSFSSISIADDFQDDLQDHFQNGFQDDFQDDLEDIFIEEPLHEYPSCSQSTTLGLSSQSDAVQVPKKQETVKPKPKASASNTVNHVPLPGRAPAKPISCRDCTAILSSHFNDSFCPEADLRKIFSEYEVRIRFNSEQEQEKDGGGLQTVTWKRTLEDGKEKEENQLLVVLNKETAVKLIAGSGIDSLEKGKDDDVITLDDDNDDDDDEFNEDPILRDPPAHDLVWFVQNLSTKYPGKDITLIIMGMMSYFKSLGNKEVDSLKMFVNGIDKKKKSRRKSLGLPVISESELTEALIDLEFRTEMTGGARVHSILCERPLDVVTQVAAYSRSVAEYPFKKQRQEVDLDWFAQNDNKSCVDLKDLEKDVPRLWSKQLQQFPKVSKDVAEAIVKKYPNLDCLLKKYRDCTPPSEGQHLLANISVGKNGKRRVGPETSLRIWTFFTNKDPDAFICRQVR